MKLQSVIRENGILGLLFIPKCWVLGHDFHIGQRCVCCHEPRGKF